MPMQHSVEMNATALNETTKIDIRERLARIRSAEETHEEVLKSCRKWTDKEVRDLMRDRLKINRKKYGVHDMAVRERMAMVKTAKDVNEAEKESGREWSDQERMDYAAKILDDNRKLMGK